MSMFTLLYSLSVLPNIVSSSILENLFVFRLQSFPSSSVVLVGSVGEHGCPTCWVLLCSSDRDLNPRGFAVDFIFNTFCQPGRRFASRVLHSCSRTWTGSGDHWPSETCLLMAGQDNPERTPHKTWNMPGPPAPLTQSKRSYKSASWHFQPRQEAFPSDLGIVGNQIQATETGAGVKEEEEEADEETSSHMRPSAH